MMKLDSGPEIQFNAITATNGSARSVGLAYVVDVNIPNVLEKGKMPWRYSHYNWGVEHRLITINSGDAKIIDEAQKNRLAGLGDYVDYMENRLWECPTLARFEIDPVGIPYFVVKSATAATDANNYGFNGTVPSGYTLVANLNPTTAFNGRYKNYSDAYTSVAKDDLIRKMRRAAEYTDFKPFVKGIPTHETGNEYGIYTNYSVRSTMVEILESQNDNLGSDMSKYEDTVYFLKRPVVSVPQLRADTTGPVYMLNWNSIGAMGLKGHWLNEQHFEKNPNQPTTSFTVVDSAWNMYCTNRRRQAVLSTGTTMPSGAGS